MEQECLGITYSLASSFAAQGVARDIHNHVAWRTHFHLVRSARRWCNIFSAKDLAFFKMEHYERYPR